MLILDRAFWLLLCLAGYVISVAGAESMAYRNNRRALKDAASNDLQTGDCGSNPMTGSGCYSRASTVVSGGTLVQECTMAQNTFFMGKVLVRPEDNLHTMSSACCQSCFAQPNCNMWVHCPAETGCLLPMENLLSSTTIIINSSNIQALFPQHGCQLLNIPLVTDFQGDLMSDTLAQYRITDQNLTGSSTNNKLPFTSGSLIQIELPKLENYTLLPGSSLVKDALDYDCPNTGIKAISPDPTGKCVVRGVSVKKVASICDADAECYGFEYRPSGKDYGGQPIAILKGMKSPSSASYVVDIPFPLVSNLRDDPSSFLFIKHGSNTDYNTVATDKSGSNTNSSTSGGGVEENEEEPDILWIVLPTLAAVCLAFVSGVVCFIYIHTRRRAVKDATTKLEITSQSSATGSDPSFQSSIHVGGNNNNDNITTIATIGRRSLSPSTMSASSPPLSSPKHQSSSRAVLMCTSCGTTGGVQSNGVTLNNAALHALQTLALTQLVSSAERSSSTTATGNSSATTDSYNATR